MRTIYEVWYTGYQGKKSYWRGRETRREAEQELVQRIEWAKVKYPEMRHWIEEKEAEDWPIPPREKPADRYWWDFDNRPTDGKHWATCHIRIHESVEGDRIVGEYDRNYSPLKTFHPFRQLRDGTWKDYALISEKYTETAVMDLATGEIIARVPPPKDANGHDHPSWGFCPVEFYVPDWWDVHGYGEESKPFSIPPGSHYWGPKYERPIGDFGFVSGCVWGDDSSWKIRYLDLSRISEGVITEDARFGYIELPYKVDLKDAVTYWPGSDGFAIAVMKSFRRDGSAGDDDG